ncbi:MAG: hypothetical protein ABW278_10585 [Steroidobacteraceae bacterium]
MNAPRVSAAVAAILVAHPALPASREIPAEWVGRYQAKVVSASSGMDNDASTSFGGEGVPQTNFHVQTLACATEFSMDISRSGAISGRGKIMYVYRGNAGNAMTMLAPGAVGAPGGFAMNLKDGKQYRDWNFTGSVTPDGAVEINGIPDTAMDYLNSGKWEKHRPWSALPATDKDHMRGPFKLQLANEKGEKGPVPAIRVDRFLQLDDALIRRVRYQTIIQRSDANIVPACKLDEPAPPKCPATEYLKTKAKIGVEGIYTVESSRDLQSGQTSVNSEVGGGMTGGFSGDSSGGVQWEGGAGPMTGTLQMNPADGSYSVSVGVGVDTGSVLPGPFKLSEKLELVYDSACGFGIKGTGEIGAGATSNEVEGVIFLTKGP